MPDQDPHDRRPAASGGPDADPSPAASSAESGTRVVPVTGVGHPLVDRAGSGPQDLAWSITESRAPVVHLSAARINLLSRAAEQGRRLILVTDERSALTHPLATLWRGGGGCWVVRSERNGLRDGFSGRALGAVEDVLVSAQPGRATALGADEIAVRHLQPARLDALQLTALASSRHPARSGTLLGGPVEAISTALLGQPPRVWGLNEPAGLSFDRGRLTAPIRERMPDGSAVVVASPGLSALVSGRRTRHGVEELTHAQFALESDADVFARRRDAADQALRDLAATGMPLVALLLARPGRKDLLIRPFLGPPPSPVSLLIGAPAVRGFGLDTAAFARDLGAEVVGRPRTPALLFSLGPLGGAAWQRLDAILSALDPERLREALGLISPVLDAERPAGPAGPDGGGHAQS